MWRDFCNFRNAGRVQQSPAAESIAHLATKIESRKNQVGITTTPLNPGGKALFQDELCIVITQGEMVESGTSVKVIGNSGSDLVVVED